MKVLCNKKWLAAALVSGALMFQVLPSGCSQYFSQLSLSAFDFCSVFNCSGSQFFDICTPVPLLVDCPQTTTTTQQ